MGEEKELTYLIDISDSPSGVRLVGIISLTSYMHAFVYSLSYPYLIHASLTAYWMLNFDILTFAMPGRGLCKLMCQVRDKHRILDAYSGSKHGELTFSHQVQHQCLWH